MKQEQLTLLKTVGIFNDSYPPIMDGVALAAQNYAKWIHHKGVPVCVVAPKYPDYKDSDDFPVYRYASIPLLLRKPYRLGLPDIDLQIKLQLENTDFGIVHTHCPFSSGQLALRVAKDRKLPLVATFHSKFKDDFERVINNKQVVQLMIKEVIRFFEKADEVWIPQASVEETIREYGFKGAVEVVDNGNDFLTEAPIAPIKEEARQKLGIKEDELMFLFVGQHIWEKNIRLIIETLAALQGVNYKMFFVGIGYAQEALKTLTKSLNISDKVFFQGLITDREDLKSYYAAADLFLFPSLYDNAPLVVREAAAMHTPSVMIKGSTASAVIEDNINGFLIDNSKESFIERLEAINKERTLIKTVGQRAAQTLARSWQSITDEVIDRYIQLIKRTQK